MKILSYNLDRAPMEIKAVTDWPYYWPESSLSKIERKYRGDENRFHSGIILRGDADSGANTSVWLIVPPDPIDQIADCLRDLEAEETRAAGYIAPARVNPGDRAHVYQVIQNFNAGRCGV
jgi:hypothetical protein